MMITRRNLLACTAAGFISPELAFGQEALRLRAEHVEVDLMPGKAPTPLWGYNGSSPGPALHARKGGRLRILFENAVPEASAVHWHGIRIDNSMDGVPDLTQPMVKPGEEFQYDFTVPDAGTYWYHSHHRSWEQVARGLYGALIVAESNPPRVDHDIVTFVDDWRLDEDGSQAGEFDNMPEQRHAGRIGNFAKAIFQGLSASVKSGERIRLRLINPATDRVFTLRLSGLEGMVVAYDGMPLQTPETIGDLVLAPAQRADIIADVTGDEIAIDHSTEDGLNRLGSISVVKGGVRRGTTDIDPLEPNRYLAPDLADALELELDMDGGAVEGWLGIVLSGENWTFNGVSGMPDDPLFRFRRGQTAVINLSNNTDFAHAIHLHGNHFQALDSGRLGPLRDTILVEADQSRLIACVFDNPGKWLLHCHMLGHQAAGMKSWVEVV